MIITEGILKTARLDSTRSEWAVAPAKLMKLAPIKVTGGTLGTAGHNSDTFEKKNRLDRIAYGKISLLVADGKNKS